MSGKDAAPWRLSPCATASALGQSVCGCWGGWTCWGPWGCGMGPWESPWEELEIMTQVSFAGLWKKLETTQNRTKKKKKTTLVNDNKYMYTLVVSNFLTSPRPLAWKGTPAVFFSCWAVSVAGIEKQKKRKNISPVPKTPASVSREQQVSSLLHFWSSSALSVALLGFRFSWKCLTGGVRGPTSVVKALLFRYWHSRGSMADASHSLTGWGGGETLHHRAKHQTHPTRVLPFSRSSPRISCTLGFCSSKSRLREPVSGKDLRISATISTQGSESTVASWIISDRASFIWPDRWGGCAHVDW